MPPSSSGSWPGYNDDRRGLAATRSGARTSRAPLRVAAKRFDDGVSAMLLLSCTNLSRGYDATPLFEDVAFELHAGERFGFGGPNGAGKTTLLKALAGVDEPDTGKVTLHAGARLGFLHQV